MGAATLHAPERLSCAYRSLFRELAGFEDDEDHDHSLCPTRHGWDYSVVFYGIIPSNRARVPHNRPTNAESWEIPFSREGLAFLGEIAQLKVRDARSISPPGLGEVE
jgi:hypothetical protein